jgi:bacterioferritin
MQIILTRTDASPAAARRFSSPDRRATLLARLDRAHRKETYVNIANKKNVIEQLNRILECELAGVVRYTHYSMMIFGYNRIPIVSWFRAEAAESLTHAQQAGEMITRLGGHPSLAIGPLLETHEHDIGQILRETLEAEHTALGLYTKLLKLVASKNVALEEYARNLIEQEEAHIDEIDKMLRKPGEVQVSKEARELD